MTELHNLISKYLDESGHLNDLFVQLFVESNNVLNYAYFMQFHEIQATYGQINTALKDLTGSKAVKYREVEHVDYVMENFKNSMYRFGRYLNARDWIQEVSDVYGVVPSRHELLGWIAKQRPDKSASSFSPSDDRNLYVAGKD